jgi:integrase/recombinase XerD
LTPRQFDAWVERRGWGASLSRQALSALKGYARWRYGQVPLLAHKIRPKEPEPQRTITVGEFQQVLAWLNTTRPAERRNLALLLVAFDTGLRASEICRLRICDLNLSERTFQVRQKGGGIRAGLYSETTSALLGTWLTRDRPSYGPSDRLFVGVQGEGKGRPLTASHLKIICRRLAKRSGVRHFSPHSLRRGFAVELTRNGAPLHLVAMAGGWKSLEMVQRYTQTLRV